MQGEKYQTLLYVDTERSTKQKLLQQTSFCKLEDGTFATL